MTSTAAIDLSRFENRMSTWSGVGRSTAGATTAQEALEVAGLNWSVTKTPLAFHTDSGWQPTPVWAVVREDTQRFLGVVRKNYEVFQNLQHFEFGDSLVESGDAEWAFAGSIRSDRLVFMVMRLPQDIIIGGHDPVARYLLITSAHDGSKAVTVMNVPERVASANVLNWPVRAEKATFSIRHIRSMRGRLTEAQRALHLSLGYMDRFADEANILYDRPVSDDEFKQIVDVLIPNRPRKDDVARDLIGLWYESPTLIDLPRNGWRAINAVGEYFDHYRNARTAESRMVGSIFGVGRKARNQAVELLLSA